MQWDLNCDLGEGEPTARTRALMRWVTSVNVACGGHAGDAETMERVAILARDLGVRLGAHPGVPGEFGRGEVSLTPGMLRTLLLQQVSALHQLAQRQESRLHHVKLHGALYHAVECTPSLGRAYVETVGRWFPGLRIYARTGGPILDWARKAGVEAWAEGFADRSYQEDGHLVPRGREGAVLTRPQEVTRRLLEWRTTGGWKSQQGTWLRIPAQTLCLHGDTPGSLILARAIRKALS